MLLRMPCVGRFPTHFCEWSAPGKWAFPITFLNRSPTSAQGLTLLGHSALMLGVGCHSCTPPRGIGLYVTFSTEVKPISQLKMTPRYLLTLLCPGSLNPVPAQDTRPRMRRQVPLQEQWGHSRLFGSHNQRTEGSVSQLVVSQRLIPAPKAVTCFLLHVAQPTIEASTNLVVLNLKFSFPRRCL